MFDNHQLIEPNSSEANSSVLLDTINRADSSHTGDAAMHNYYLNGDVIPQVWNPVFVCFAFITSFVASYAAVRLLDHSTWRSEREKEHASVVIIKFPQVVSAIILGFGTVWSMHFVGMAAVTLNRVPMCIHWPTTAISLAAAVTFMWAGVKIAERDIFAGSDRLKLLKDIVVAHRDVTMKGQHRKANRIIHFVAFLHKPWFILTGATVAAAGALIMHYIGMLAVRGPFKKVWSIPYVSISVALGVVVCCAGFWILFRLLRWKVEQFWLRPVSAAVIASAVCFLHFFGMLSVSYVYQESKDHECVDHMDLHILDPNHWTPHQILALAVGLTVPTLALLIEHLINRELFHAYCKLKNPTLTMAFIVKAAKKSRNAEIRRASMGLMDSAQLRRSQSAYDNFLLDFSSFEQSSGAQSSSLPSDIEAPLRSCSMNVSSAQMGGFTESSIDRSSEFQLSSPSESEGPRRSFSVASARISDLNESIHSMDHSIEFQASTLHYDSSEAPRARSSFSMPATRMAEVIEAMEDEDSLR